MAFEVPISFWKLSVTPYRTLNEMFVQDFLQIVMYLYLYHQEAQMDNGDILSTS